MGLVWRLRQRRWSLGEPLLAYLSGDRAPKALAAKVGCKTTTKGRKTLATTHVDKVQWHGWTQQAIRQKPNKNAHVYEFLLRAVFLIASEDAAQAEARLRRRLKRQNMENITIKTCLAAEMPGDTACQYVRLPAFNPSTWKHAHGTK